mmetsp:Transcript_48185/g.111661  ORF Transcript_48185/g.111661 Transcript_48185/m.111661 type:complete len:527 (-) Transcript_48185:100-1680(-)
MSRSFVLATLCLARLDSSSGWVQPPSRAAALHVRPRAGSLLRPVVRPCSGKLLVKEPATELGSAYSVAGKATMVTWVACVMLAWAENPMPNRLLHLLTGAQPLTPLPLVASVFTALSRSASKEGWWAMNRLTYRRLNLGVATACLWLAAVATFTQRTYSGLFAFVVAAVHLATALFCISVWLHATRSSAGHHLSRLARGTVGSLWALAPQTSETGTISKSGSASHLDDPDEKAGRDGRNEYSVACLLFLWFTVMPNLVDLPLATVPALLGKKLVRAGSAWTFLAAVAAYVLKDATQRGRIHSGTTFRYLRVGFIAASGTHLVLVALELLVAGGGIRHLRADIASVVMHGLVVLAALTPPPKVPKAVAAPTTPAAPATAVAPPTAAILAAVPAPATAERATKPAAATKATTPAELIAAAAPVSTPAKHVEATAVAGAVARPFPSKASQSHRSSSGSKLHLNQKVVWKDKKGTVRFIGPTKFASGEWIGVELDKEVGMHDGMVLGIRYFTCPRGRGIFAEAAQLKPVG